MKDLVIATAAVGALIFSATGACADELGAKPKQDGNLTAIQLAEMGLGGMTAISDRQGEQIRGSGFAFTFGFSFATGGAPDGYFRPRSHFSAGASFSSGAGGFAGGGSIAFAN